MSKRNRDKRACARQERYQQERQNVIDTMTKLQAWGLVGQAKEENGDIAWEITPEHQARLRMWAQEIFSHPERWDEVPAFRNRKAELFAMREEAIKTGYITIE